jgi:hypothetical protein
MGKVVAATFRVGRKLTGLLEEIGEASHKFERQRRVRQLLTFEGVNQRSSAGQNPMAWMIVFDGKERLWNSQ